MGQMRNFEIEAKQKAWGIEPATGQLQTALDMMSRLAFELIKIIELERSGIRDGDGFWSGSDPLGGTVQEIEQHMATVYRLTGGLGPDIGPRIGKPREQFDWMDVGDSARALVEDGIDLDDRAAVEAAIINPHKSNPASSAHFVDQVISAAKISLSPARSAGDLPF